MGTLRSISRDFALLACGLSFAAALSACGSGGATTSALTKAEYIKKANGICREAQARRNASFIKATHSQPSGISEKAARERLISDGLMPPIVQMNKELEELQPPTSEAAASKRLTSSFGLEIKGIEANPISVYTGARGQFVKANEVAIAIGLKQCSEV